MYSQPDIDDDLIARHLGPQYRGRRFLRYSELEALGLVDNRASLKNWMAAGAFPRGLRIAGKAGKVLLWEAVEIARLVAQRVNEAKANQEVDPHDGHRADPETIANTPGKEVPRGFTRQTRR